MNKYKDEAEFYKERSAAMEKCLDLWRDKAIERSNKIAHIEGRLEVYEKLFSKFFEKPTDNDEVFIFQGRVFVPVTHTLSHDRGSVDRLDVTFEERVVR